jgi:hypothetical protein
MNAPSKKDPIHKTPAWLLERLAQGELDAAQAASLRARLAAEGRSLDDELAALARSNQELLAERPKAVAAAAIRQRAEQAPWRAARASRLNLWIAPLALAGSVGVALLVGHPWRGLVAVGPAVPGHAGSHAESPAGSAGETIGIKGAGLGVAPRLLVYRQRSAGIGADARTERLSDGAPAARGDLLQLAYASANDGLYGVLLSVDGAGRVTQHLPEEGARSAAPLRALREIHLPSAYELDDAPGFERFLLVTASQPFPVATVIDAARALAAHGAQARTSPLALTPAFHQTSVLLHKTSKGTP